MQELFYHLFPCNYRCKTNRKKMFPKRLQFDVKNSKIYTAIVIYISKTPPSSHGTTREQRRDRPVTIARKSISASDHRFVSYKSFQFHRYITLLSLKLSELNQSLRDNFLAAFVYSVFPCLTLHVSN